MLLTASAEFKQYANVSTAAGQSCWKLQLSLAGTPGASTNGFDRLWRRRGAGRALSPHPEVGTGRPKLQATVITSPKKFGASASGQFFRMQWRAPRKPQEDALSGRTPGVSTA